MLFTIIKITGYAVPFKSFNATETDLVTPNPATASGPVIVQTELWYTFNCLVTELNQSCPSYGSTGASLDTTADPIGLN